MKLYKRVKPKVFNFFCETSEHFLPTGLSLSLTHTCHFSFRTAPPRLVLLTICVLWLDWCSSCVGGHCKCCCDFEGGLKGSSRGLNAIRKGQINRQERRCSASTFVSETFDVFRLPLTCRSSFHYFTQSAHTHKFKLEAGLVLLPCLQRLFALPPSGTPCCVSTSTSRPNPRSWPCRSPNERRRRRRREDRREGVTGCCCVVFLTLGTLLRAGQLLMDRCPVCTGVPSFLPQWAAAASSSLQPSAACLSQLSPENDRSSVGGVLPAWERERVRMFVYHHFYPGIFPLRCKRTQRNDGEKRDGRLKRSWMPTPTDSICGSMPRPHCG